MKREDISRRKMYFQLLIGSYRQGPSEGKRWSPSGGCPGGDGSEILEAESQKWWETKKGGSKLKPADVLCPAGVTSPSEQALARCPQWKERGPSGDQKRAHLQRERRGEARMWSLQGRSRARDQNLLQQEAQKVPSSRATQTCTRDLIGWCRPGRI